MDRDEILTTGEVAEIFRVRRATVIRWTAEEKIPFFRLPSGQRRYWRSEIEPLLRRPASA